MLNIFNRETVLSKNRLHLKEQSRFKGLPQDSRELLREVSVKIYIFVYLYFFFVVRKNLHLCNLSICTQKLIVIKRYMLYVISDLSEVIRSLR